MKTHGRVEVSLHKF